MGQFTTTKVDLMKKAIDSSELAEIDTAVLGFADDIIGRGAALNQDSTLGPFRKAFGIAGAITMLHAAITDQHMRLLMPLQNRALGFLTDRPKEGYSQEVVKECVIEAVLQGYLPTGNEFNIIAGRFYATKNGLARKVREFPGLADLRLNLLPPRAHGDGGAIVVATATWNREGKPDSITREIPVKVNSGMGPDAILGKATRKLLASVYGVLTGSEYTVPDGEVDDTGRGSFDPSRMAPTVPPVGGTLAKIEAVAKELPPEPEPTKPDEDAPKTTPDEAAEFVALLDEDAKKVSSAGTPRPPRTRGAK
jgi:hypothetical protein